MSGGELVFPETGMTARDEIRVSEFGLLRCPSCGELAAELLGRHCLILCHGKATVTRETWRGCTVLLLEAGKPWCECRDGQRTELDGWDSWVAAANISLADEVWRLDTIAFRATGFPA